ncbi:MAG: DUF3185 family protein [Gammaproteobacteria bacterium]|nr:DUF3185 family protein [Gammaproteobacteria bacterium]
MAHSSSKILSIILMVIGIGLAIWAYMASDSVTSHLSSALTGSPTDRVMMFYIGGAVSFAVGLYLFIKNK